MKRKMVDLLMQFISLLAVGAALWVHATVLSPWLIAHGSSAAFDLAIGIFILLGGVFLFLLLLFFSDVEALIYHLRWLRRNSLINPQKKEV